MDRSIFQLQVYLEQKLKPNPKYSDFRNLWNELLVFGYKNAVSCVFPVFIFGMLAVSKLIPLGPLPRYDFLLLCCFGMQCFMYFTQLESAREVAVICLFHVLGIVMEWFKVSHGSWAYPEFAYSKIGGVPLYSGFMYASVASYMAQAWRRFDLEMTAWPKAVWVWGLGGAVYLNFFSNQLFYDFRYWLFGAVFLVFLRSWVFYTTNGQRRKMPVSLSFVLIAFFIFLAENIATFFGAWKYAYQHKDWQPVHLQKYSSWILMCIVAYLIVAQLHITLKKRLAA